MPRPDRVFPGPARARTPEGAGCRHCGPRRAAPGRFIPTGHREGRRPGHNLNRAFGPAT